MVQVVANVGHGRCDPRGRLAPGMREEFREATRRALLVLAESDDMAMVGIALQTLRRAALAETGDAAEW